MSLLFETIACNNGKLQNLEWHNARLNRSRKKLFNSLNQLFLEKVELPDFVDNGNWKCKVHYGKAINGISFQPYTPRLIKSFSLVESNIDYDLKYEERDEIDALFRNKNKVDEVVIIKDGFVTDSSIANILLFNGKSWVTPNTPLLKGTMRAQLLHNKRIATESVKVTAIFDYQKIMFINALNPFDETSAIPITKETVNI